jgi:hypothetical protein
MKIQDFTGKKNLIFSTLPWAMLATWLHLGPLQNIQEN